MPDRRRPVVILRLVLLVVALGVGASIGLHVASAGVPYWYTIAFTAVAVVTVAMTRSVRTGVHDPAVPDSGVGAQPAPVVAILAPIERRLANATRDRRLYTTRLRLSLYDLARERVQRRGGPDLGDLDELAASPLAPAVLGEELFAWLTDTTMDGPAPSPDQVHRLVRAIEAL